MTHPAIDAFGDLDEAAADPHVRACERCRAELDAQLQVRALLMALPDPGPVPPDVLNHLEGTLRSLAGTPLEGAADGRAGERTAGRTVVPLHEAPTARRRRRPLLAAAAALVVVAGGGTVLSQVLTGSSSDTSSGASASLDSGAGRRALADKGNGVGVRSIASGTDYTKAQLASQVQTVMSRAGSAAPAPMSAPSSGKAAAGPRSLTGADGSMAAPSGVRACLDALGAPSATPLLVDVARFEGKPAAVVVLPAEQGAREVWVVSTSCKPGADGTRYYTVLH